MTRALRQLRIQCFHGLLLCPFFSIQASTLKTRTEISLSALKNTEARLISCLQEAKTSQWVLELPQGTVINEGGILTKEGHILEATKTSFGDQHALLRPQRNLEEENPLSFKGRLAVLSSPGSENWYHWLLQILPRLIILKESKVAYDRIYINNLTQKWQKESLKAVLDFLDIPQEKILVINGDCIVKATTLIVPSVPFIPLKNTPLPQWLVTRLREIFYAPSPTPTILPIYDKIYISRTHAKGRHVTNEHELIQALEQEGFQTLHLEELPPHFQASLFRHARVIVGPHGSGFANLVFAEHASQNGCLVVEIDYKTSPPRSFYQAFAKSLSCRYEPFYLPSPSTGDLDTDMTVDVKTFLKFLKPLLSLDSSSLSP